MLDRRSFLATNLAAALGSGTIRAGRGREPALLTRGVVLVPEPRPRGERPGGRRHHLTRWIWSDLTPRSSRPTFWPAIARSSGRLNCSTLVTTVSSTPPRPRISTFVPGAMTPCSTLPVATVPRPSMVWTPSIGMRNGRSVARFGSGM